MGKNKLKKFAELENNPLVLQYPFRTIEAGGFPLKGRWRADFFHNDNPIVLELGCGKGEYTVGLARRYPDKNFIGIDIKGARIWSGAKTALNDGMTNVAFVRTSIELLEAFFAPGEVAEIWITFPDPQMKKVNKRLTGTRFMEMYRHVLQPGGMVHLKTDSPFLYTYTTMMAEHNSLEILENTADLYATLPADDPILNIRTHYEQQWLDRGLTIKYFSFRPGTTPALEEPPGADDIAPDTYRSYSRGYIECPQLLDDDANAEK
ncbi:MAG: tRNA (guanosine(46)-N7)-methyltransferase TrmB [Muribaculaceae bacterium]|nr:tRNA (guanosine(46)-N7)-methyltransferase TrmB [Muribaculaceae bacterium]